MNAGGKDVVVVDPPRIQGQGDVAADTRVDGGDNLLGDVDGFDHRGKEGVGSLDTVEERGAELAGFDQDGTNQRVGGGELRGQGLVEGRDAGLGCGVVRQLGGACVTDDAGDGDDGAALLVADYGGEEGLEGVEIREEVGRESLLDLSDGRVEERLAVYDSGVVDEDGNGAELVGTSSLAFMHK